jgi:hypothetical protein
MIFQEHGIPVKYLEALPEDDEGRQKKSWTYLDEISSTRGGEQVVAHPVQLLNSGQHLG